MPANSLAQSTNPQFVVGRADAVVLDDMPIEPSWIRSGDPRARAGLLTPSVDGNAKTMVWECTAGSFQWTFFEEETVVILEGEVRVTSAGGEMRVLGPGDTAYFAEGTNALWEIDNYVKKIAFCRRQPIGPVKALRIMLGRMRRSLAGEDRNKTSDAQRSPTLRTIGLLALTLPL